MGVLVYAYFVCEDSEFDIAKSSNKPSPEFDLCWVSTSHRSQGFTAPVHCWVEINHWKKIKRVVNLGLCLLWFSGLFKEW